ncbi:MAG TPA: glycoside hydrolase family 16 protein [Azospirillaceae bacterium]|nr:glycoside hydrolase family 16 protein [Azospirillaceae bacterium]
MVAMAIGKRLATAGVVALAAALSPLHPARAVDLDRYALTFAEEFDGFDRRSETRPQGRWDTMFVRFNVRRLPDNKEAQVYADPDFKGTAPDTLGVNPFSIKDGVLTVEAAPADRFRVLPYVQALPYTSGMISTERSFAQRYGYFEMRARLPVGRGLWPAFWMLSTSGRWPPEIDVFESLGHETGKVYMTAHQPKGKMSEAKLDVAGWHTYGVEWTAETITWIIDGVEVKREPNRIHEPMYLIANLAVGGEGSWPGAPDPATVFPARMEIDHIRAYTPKPATPEAATR